jgi:subtilase family serine protease
MKFNTTPFQKWIALVVFIGLSIEAPLRLTSAQVNASDRVTRAIEERSTSVLRGHLHRLATASADQGRVGPGFRLDRVTMMFKPTGAQQAALAAFLDQLHNPSSPEYQHWLTPAEFADRFGMSRADMDKIVGWLRAQGFAIEDVATSRLWVTFSGNARQVESAFKTEIHQYVVNGMSHYANATEPAVPDALADVVLGLQSLHNFRIKPRFHSRKTKFTSNITGNHFLVPDDLTTIYDIKKAYSAGTDGTGQSIAVMGQTDILLSDIETFRSLSGLPANDPSVTLVPGSDDPGISNDDLTEADLDLEWAGAVAPNAQILYVNSNNGAFDSLLYAIGQNLAPIVSISYGDCESHFTSADLNMLRMVTQQANAQGITIAAPAGDAGAADCDGSFDGRQIARLGPSVDVPASLPYVTGIGGSTLYDVGSYWSSTNNGKNGSALSYIPEVAWNDTLVFGETGLVAGGGGRSSTFPKPSWQVGRGVPQDNARDVPDVSLAASTHVGYLICSAGSCVNGFRASDDSLTVIGGTSVGAPVFAGIIALLDQKLNSAQGNVNPGLYILASAAPNAFHDIVNGANWLPCQSGSPGCSFGVLGYTATRGYDLATGLGSVDVFNFLSAWSSILTPR